MRRILVIALTLVLAASSSAFADGDAKKGKKVFRKCAACHSVEEGQNKVGPSLYGIIDRTAASVEGFKNYSDALKEADLVWDEETLRAFLTKPRAFLKGTNMAFAGIKKEKDLNNLMAFLNEATKAAE